MNDARYLRYSCNIEMLVDRVQRRSRCDRISVHDALGTKEMQGGKPGIGGKIVIAFVAVLDDAANELLGGKGVVVGSAGSAVHHGGLNGTCRTRNEDWRSRIGGD